MPRQKDILTTGEVAKICNVAPRTVSKWFDSGQLKGYRIPGSKDRRIPMSSLVRFMKAHQIPMDGLQSGRTRVLLVEAGVACERFRPHVMFVDMHLPDVKGDQVMQLVRRNDDLQMTRVVAMSNKLTEGQGQHLTSHGFDGYIKKPFHVRTVIEAVEDATAIVY